MIILSFIRQSFLRAALICAFALPVFLYAQQGKQTSSFEVFADAKQALLRSYIEVTFVLRNAEGSDFRPPSFYGFTIVAGPSRSISTTIVNGEMSTEAGYVYTLQPRQLGKLEIGSASIRVNGRVLKSKPLSIEILDAKKAGIADAGAASVFLRAEPNVTDAWIGQQISLDYKIFTVEQVGSFNPIAESDYRGFFAEEVRRFNAPLQREIYKGKLYNTKVIRRMALFPQQSGDFTIEPFEVQLHLLSGDENNSSFFFNRQIKRVPASTAPISIKVKALPASAPASFSGAVGRFSATFGFSSQELSTDDALSLRIAVTGDGDPKRLQAPSFEIPENFDAYPPKMAQERYYEDNGRIISEKIFEYLFVPQKAGTYVFNPAFSYFDTDSVKYVVLKGEPATIHVTQGTQQQRPAIIEAQNQAKQQDIRPLKTNIALQEGQSLLWGKPLLAVLVFLPVFSFGAALVMKRRKKVLENRDPLELRRQRAQAVAMQRLAQARNHLQLGQSRAFYDEITKALTEYVCTKLQIPLSAWSKDNAGRQMANAGIAETIIQQFSGIMQTCEMALFAGMDNAAAMQDTIQKAEQVIIGIEEV